MGAKRGTVEERLRRFYTESDGCWEWTGALNDYGYGRFTVSAEERVLAHRLMYQLYVGPIPDKFQVDHLCSNRACVRPDHLEPVTPAENNKRIIERGGHGGLRKTHCPEGHPYEGENLYVIPSSGGRVCNTCRRGRYWKRAFDKAVRNMERAGR